MLATSPTLGRACWELVEALVACAPGLAKPRYIAVLHAASRADAPQHMDTLTELQVYAGTFGFVAKIRREDAAHRKCAG